MIKIHVFANRSEIYHNLEHMQMNLTMLFLVYVGLCRCYTSEKLFRSRLKQHINPVHKSVSALFSIF